MIMSEEQNVAETNHPENSESDLEGASSSNRNKILAAVAGTALIAILAIWFLAPRIFRPAQTEKPAEAEKNEAGTVKFLMEQQWLIRMKLARVEEQVVSRQITATGRVVPAANS